MRSLPIAPTPLLAGRHHELTVLLDRFKAAVAGHANVVLVAGEPGIGKTRLLEEGARLAGEEGAAVLRGGASEGAGMPPYLPFLEALGAHIRTAPLDQLRNQAGQAAPTLTSIFPELAMRLKKLPRAYTLPPEQARLRLYEAVGSFVAAIASLRPLVLICDDLQWADAASLDLFCHVPCHHPADRLLILGAYREEDAQANSALARAVDHLNRHRMLTTVILSRLSNEEIASLAASYLGSAVDPAASHLLYIHSEGNPFFAEELLRGWLETGGLARQGERWAVAPGFDPGRIPPGIVGAIHQRVGRLPPDVTTLLHTAAIIGRTFDLSLLAAAEDQPVDVVEERLLTACRAALLRTDRVGAYTFSHDKIRECLYTQVAPGRRQRLHEAIGLALEARDDREGASHLSALAFHFVRSGDRERGITHSARAAETALRTYAAEEAMAHYRAALGLLAPDDGRRAEILLGLGKAALLANVAAAAASAYETARAWGIRAGDLVTAARAAMGLGEAHIRSGAWQAALVAWEAAVALLENHPGPEAVRALASLATIEGFMGQFTEGIRHAERALELARRLGDMLLECRALRSLGTLLMRVNKVAPGMQALEQALKLAASIDDPSEAAQCYFRLTVTTERMAELRRCREMSLAWLDSARRAHDPYQVLMAQAGLTRLAVTEGNWSQAEWLVAQVRPAVEHMANTEPLESLLKSQGRLAYLRGDYAAAEQEYSALEASFKKSPEAMGREQGLLGLAQLAVGKRHEAQTYMVEQEALLAALEEGSMPTAPILASLATMALQMGDRERVLRYYPRLLAFQGQHHHFLVDRVLGAIETLRGDWPTAEAHLATAEAVARQEGFRPELPLILAEQGNLEVARGGRGSAMRARALLGQALRLFEELGMAAEAGRARERLRTLPRQPGEPDRLRYPAGLSGREVQVLRLVAAGRSNRQIAHELVLSEKTVARHLTSIYTKTATDNRAGAAAFAVHHGLA